MGEFEFSPTAQQWVNVVLIWVGFGALAGLLARTVLPAKEPLGAVGTLVIGIAGTTLGLFGLTLVTRQTHPDANPISPVGMLAAVAGALALLAVYRVLQWSFTPEKKPDEKKKDKEKE